MPAKAYILPWQAQLAQILQDMRVALPHALLLQGARGLGKRALAVAWVKDLLCEGKQAIACGECPACHWFEEGNHPDFLLVEAEQDSVDNERSAPSRARSPITIAQIRAARDFLQVGAHRGGLRIVLIYPAEEMNLAAANALLKTLEEPPAGALLVLVSHQPAKLTATVRSRCQVVSLHLPTMAVAEQWLVEQGIQSASLSLSLAGGAPLLAMDLADASWQEMRQALLSELVAGNFNVVEVAARYAKLDTVNFSVWLTLLQQWAHDLVSVLLTQQIRYHSDYHLALVQLSQRTNAEKLLQFEQMLLNARRAVAHPLNLQMVIEDIFIRYNQLFAYNTYR